MVLYFFYKNLVFTIPQFFFSFVCAFSGQTVFDDWYITLYNIIFTAAPLVVRAVIEQDLSYKIEKPKYEAKCIQDPFEKFEIKPMLKEIYPKIYYIG